MIEKIFRLSVSDVGDSVVQTGKVGVDHKTKYFQTYEEALENIKEQCAKWIDEL